MSKLELERFCYSSILGAHYRLQGTIAAVSGGRSVSYVTKLRNQHGEPVARGELQDHPRWSEPLIAVVARCLNSALEDRLDPWFAFQHATLDVALRGQRIANLACVSQLWPTCSREQLPSLFDAAAPPNAWAIACLACTASAWQQLSMPPMPKPLHVPVYEYAGIRYCRAADLPDEARETFDRWAFGASTPAVPGVPDAVFEWDVQHFLGAV